MSADITPEEQAAYFLRTIEKLQEKLKAANNRNAILVTDNDKLRTKIANITAEYKLWDEGDGEFGFPSSHDVMTRVGNVLDDIDPGPLRRDVEDDKV